MPTIKTGWLKNNNGEKFSPKTLSSQVITSDGVTLESKIENDLATLENNVASKNHNHDNVYETKEDAQIKYDELVESKSDKNHIHAWDDLENKPFWAEDAVVSIVDEATYNIDPETGMATATTNGIPIIGEIYNVIYNGTEYKCLANIYDDGDISGAVLGNIGILTDENHTEEPFVIVLVGSTALVVCGDESFTISITGKNKIYHKIQMEYLPTFATNLQNGVFPGSLRSIGSCEEGGSYILGQYATSFGFDTKASGSYSHAEGQSTQASGDYSHTEGQSTQASGISSHAEGQSTQASGNGSHAEGFNTKAHGDYSHAEGYNTKASGISSHAEGLHTEAYGEFQHVQGKYNIIDSSNKYAHIVGNGSNVLSHTRSNAHTLDWDGNAWYQGTIRVGGSSFDDGNEIALKSELDVTNEEIQELREILATRAPLFENYQFISTEDINKICGNS